MSCQMVCIVSSCIRVLCHQHTLNCTELRKTFALMIQVFQDRFNLQGLIQTSRALCTQGPSAPICHLVPPLVPLFTRSFTFNA